MGAKKVALTNGDRIKINGSSKANATVIGLHAEKTGKSKADNVSILPDDRPRQKGAIVVKIDECERVGPMPELCPLCGDKHRIFYCPRGA